MLKVGKQITLLLTLSFFSVLLFFTSAKAAVFPDLSEESLYYPHIEKLYEAKIISGDTTTNTFRPADTINRAEFAKVTAFTRLAEQVGVAHQWSKMDNYALAYETVDLLEDFFNCSNGACASIGGRPFTDVAESSPKCAEDPEVSCDPWFSRYIYYAVSNGFIKGYDNGGGARSFRPEENILRIHALKMIMVDNGNISPERDGRYRRLLGQAEALGSYSPKCLKGAENYILDLNGGYTADAAKLLKYALLADRLDLFGNHCQVFGGYNTPKERALFLNKPLTRQETPRFFALTVDYDPVEPERLVDSTLNNESENAYQPAADLTYEIPAYVKTELYDSQGGDESLWADGVVEDVATVTEAVAVKTPHPIYDPDHYVETSLPGIDYANMANYNFLNPLTSKPYIDSGGGFPSTANLSTCTNKTTIACPTPMPSNCKSVQVNTAVKTVGEPEFGTRIPTYFTSLWQRVALAGSGYRYIPLDDVALDSFIGKCGLFNEVSFVAGHPTKTAPLKYNNPPIITGFGANTIYNNQPHTGILTEEDGGWWLNKWNGINDWLHTKSGTGYAQVGLGALETIGGVAQIAEGVGIAAGGTIAGFGVSGVVAIPVGTVAAVSGTTDVVSGVDRFKTGMKNIFGDEDVIIDSNGNIISNLINNHIESENARAAANVAHLGVGLLSTKSLIKNAWSGAAKMYDEAGSVVNMASNFGKNSVRAVESRIKLIKGGVASVKNNILNVRSSVTSKLSNLVPKGNPEAYVTVVHRTTPENLQKILTDGYLEGRVPVGSNPIENKLAQLTDGSEPLAWVTKGEPSLWNKWVSGQWSKKENAVIEFKIKQKDLLSAPPLKNWYGTEKTLKLEDIDGVLGYKIPADAKVTYEGSLLDEAVKGLKKLNPVHAYQSQAINKAAESTKFVENRENGEKIIRQLHDATRSISVEQPINDITSINKLSAHAKKTFDNKVNAIAKGTNGMSVIADLKNEARVIEKVSEGKEPARITDKLRNSIVYDNLDDLNAAMVDISKEFDIVQLENRFELPQASKYRDVKILIRNENGVISELQLHVKKMFNAKKLETSVYNKRRTVIKEVDNLLELKNNGKISNSQLVQLSKKEKYANELSEVSKNIYDDYWDSYNNPKKGVSKIKEEVGMTIDLVKSRIADDSEKAQEILSTTANKAKNMLSNAKDRAKSFLKFW